MIFGKNYVEPPINILSKEEAENIFTKEKVCTICANSASELSIKTEQDDLCQDIQMKLRQEVMTACKEGFRIFISGMEEGPEIWAAETVLRFKRIYETYGEEIKLFSVLTCGGTEKFRTMEEQIRFQRLLSLCDGVIFVNIEPDLNSAQERSIYIVNNSSLIVAISNIERGNILFTINTAICKNKTVRLIECNKRAILSTRTLKAQ